MARRALVCLLLSVAYLGVALPASAATTKAYATQFGRIQFDSGGPSVPDQPVTNAKLNGEYVTITLHATTSRQLQSWAIYDRSGHSFKFPKLTLKPGKSVRVHTGHGTNTATDLYAGYGNYIWTNTGDRARLRDNTNKLLDECSWSKDGNGYINC